MTKGNAEPRHTSYRADIDGLRAVAILSVLGFHAFPAWVPGGFIGVDIFFVISGYLISGILLSNLESGSFSIGDFYLRRVRRIFPALALVLLAVCLAGFYLLWPGEYAHLGRHIAGGAGFVINLMLARESGYFNDSSETNPLLHLWSLGVEEQFYILWPCMLWAAWKWKHQAGTLIAATGLFSFAASCWLINDHPVVDFYSPISRLWELLVGGALAWASYHKRGLRVPERLAEGLGAVGIVLLGASDFLFDKEMPFPGWLALLPVGGAALVIASGGATWIGRRVLSQPIVVFVGLISYPLYLWHWPLLSFAQILSGEAPERLVRMGMVFLAFVLAFLTYKFVEQPIRRGPMQLRRIVCLCIAMAAIAIVGITIGELSGLPQRFDKETAVGNALDEEHLILDWQKNVRVDECHLQDATLDERSPVCSETTRPLVLLWGDSHAASNYPGLKQLQSTMPFGLLEFTQSGCPPILELPKLTFRQNCNAINEKILRKAAELKPEVVLLAAGWKHVDYPMGDAEMISLLKLTIARIRQDVPQAKIIVLGPEPRWLSPLPAIYRRALTFKHEMPPQRSLDHLDPALRDLDRAMKAALTREVDHYISLQDLLCNEAGCLTRTGSEVDSIAFIDEEHVSKTNSILLMRQISPVLFEDLNLTPSVQEPTP